MKFDLNSEEATQKAEQIISWDEVIQRLCFIHKKHQCSEEMNHNNVHNRVRIDCLQHSDLS